MSDSLFEIAQAVIQTACDMNRLGINVNKSGNVSVRVKKGQTEGFLITPTGIAYEALQTDDLVFVPLNAQSLDDINAKRLPSSEWLMHAEVFRQKPTVNAIVHTHSVYATALACQEMSIPAFHYMVAVAGGDDIPCAPYALFGTPELADYCAKALENRHACLLSHHGVVATGMDLSAALKLAHEVENLAKTYTVVYQLGTPKILDSEKMKAVQERFKTYGKQK